jgi:hypothetical protein
MQQQVQLDGAERQLGGQAGGGVVILWCVVLGDVIGFLFTHLDFGLSRQFRGPCVNSASASTRLAARSFVQP